MRSTTVARLTGTLASPAAPGRRGQCSVARAAGSRAAPRAPWPRASCAGSRRRDPRSKKGAADRLALRTPSPHQLTLPGRRATELLEDQLVSLRIDVARTPIPARAPIAANSATNTGRIQPRRTPVAPRRRDITERHPAPTRQHQPARPSVVNPIAHALGRHPPALPQARGLTPTNAGRASSN